MEFIGRGEEANVQPSEFVFAQARVEKKRPRINSTMKLVERAATSMPESKRNYKRYSNSYEIVHIDMKKWPNEKTYRREAIEIGKGDEVNIQTREIPNTRSHAPIERAVAEIGS